MFTIKTLVGQALVAGVITDTSSFVIVDSAGEVAVSKVFKSETEAQAQIEGLANYAEGLAYAKAHYPDLSAKGHVGKANEISSYLDWVAGGRLTKEAKPAVEAVEAQDVSEPKAPADEEGF